MRESAGRGGVKGKKSREEIVENGNRATALERERAGHEETWTLGELGISNQQGEGLQSILVAGAM